MNLSDVLARESKVLANFLQRPWRRIFEPKAVGHDFAFASRERAQNLANRFGVGFPDDSIKGRFGIRICHYFRDAVRIALANRRVE